MRALVGVACLFAASTEGLWVATPRVLSAGRLASLGLKKPGDEDSSSSSSSSSSGSGSDSVDGDQGLLGEAEFYAQMRRLSVSTTIGGGGASSQTKAQTQTQAASPASEEASARLLANLAEVHSSSISIQTPL